MVAIYQGAFNMGELTPLLYGQKDLDKRALGVSYLLNMICLKHGPISRRGATYYMNEVKDSSKRTALIPFEYSTGDNFQIETGDQYFRFYKNRAPIISGASEYELASPYTQANLFNSKNIFQLHKLQSADVLYLFHPNYQQRALIRTTDTNWSLAAISFLDGPYLDINLTTTTLTPSGTSGSITLTASATTGINNDIGFQTTDVGRIVRLRDAASNWTWGIITARTSTTVVTLTINGPNLSSTAATLNWRLGVYSDTTGWPQTAVFHQGRMVLGGNATYPDRLDFGVSGGYSSTQLNFRPTAFDGTVADDNAFSITLGSDQVNSICWMMSDPKGLLIGTTGEEWIVSGSTTNSVLTPTNKNHTPMSRTGSVRLQSVRADTGNVFVQGKRRRVFDIVYSFEQDIQKPRDISIFGEHLTRGSLIAIDYLQEPYNTFLLGLNTGHVVLLTYYPDQKVFGGSRMIAGGVSDADGSDAIIEHFCCTSDPSGEKDEAYFIVKRWINGGVKRYVEYMTPYFEDGTDQEDAFQVDCGITYSGVAASTMSGLDHLEGETVKVMIDGKAHPDVVVTSGSITLNKTGTKIHAGLRNKWAVKTLEPEVATRSGQTAMQTIKRINSVIVQILNGLGLRVGTSESSSDEYTFPSVNPFGQMTPLFSGNTDEITINSEYDRTAQIYLWDDGVFPMTILSLRQEGSAYE